MTATGGSGFWGRSKPYCSFCGWNLQIAKEIERASLKQFPWSLLLFAGFFGLVSYLSKSEFALVPFFFLSALLVGSAIASWRKLKLLEASHHATAYTNPLSSVMAARESIKHVPATAHQYLWTLSKPRRVRLKPVPRAITFAFPISWIFITYFGYRIVHDQIAVSSPLATLGDLGPLLLFALIWSGVGIATIRRARSDRRLLAEGDLAMAVVIHQELSGGKRRQSTISYQFKDATWRLVKGGVPTNRGSCMKTWKYQSSMTLKIPGEMWRSARPIVN